MVKTKKSSKSSETSETYNNDDLVSIAEFARQVGRSWTWIKMKVEDGTIPVVNKKIPLNAGIKAFDKYERKIAPKSSKKDVPLPDDESAALSAEMLGARNVTSAFNKARLAEKTYQAKLKEFEYLTRRGELVEVEKVRADARDTAAKLRARLMALPVRLAAMCEGRSSREIEEILEDSLNDVLTEFNKSEFI